MRENRLGMLFFLGFVLLAATALLGIAPVPSGLGVIGASAQESTPTMPADLEADSHVRRGAYLAALGDCTACHSAPSAPAYSGGLPIRSPFGIIYSSNITPDPETGIGDYSFADFDKALRKGRSPAHHLYPAMPYTAYAKLSSEDMHDLFSYFMRGVKPVKHVPPATKLPFPFSQRWGLAIWNLVFLDDKPYEANRERGTAWNRGAYLVQGLAHCGSCHTPRGLAYQEKGSDQSSPDFLTGNTLDHWFAPNLTGDPASGLGRWSEADIAQFLRTGHASGDTDAGILAFGPMKQVVGDSMQHANDTDLSSIAKYLKSLPKQAQNGSYRPDGDAAARSVAWLSSGDVSIPGAGVYMNFCAKCHGKDGRGKALKAPTLAGNPVILSPDPSSLVRMILEGGRPHQPAGSPDVDPMPHFSEKLSDREIAAVVSFLRSTWGNEAKPIASRTVAELRNISATEPPIK